MAAEGQKCNAKQNNSSKFSREELRSLFNYSHTECDARGALLKVNPDDAEWVDEGPRIREDPGYPLHSALSTGSVSFVHRTEHK